MEQVAGSAGPFLGVADVLSGGQVVGVALHDVGEDGFGGGLLVRLTPGRRGLAGDHVRGVRFPAPGQARPDQVTDTGLVPVGQVSLRVPHRAHVD